MSSTKLRIAAGIVLAISAVLLAGAGYEVGYRDGYECGAYDAADHISETVTFGLIDLTGTDRPDHCRADIIEQRYD